MLTSITDNCIMIRLRLSSIRYISGIFLCCWMLTACANWPAPTRSAYLGQTGQLGQCADFFAALDRQTASSKVIDAAYARVTGYPYLRTNRFLASFRDDVADPERLADWVHRMQDLDRSARRIEIANLPDSALASMGWADNRDALYRRVVDCGDRLKRADSNSSENHERLRLNAVDRDEYIPLRRAAGLYPLTEIFVMQGVRQWHMEAQQAFSNEPPSDWRAIRYAPIDEPRPEAARRIVQRADRDALGIPLYSAQAQRTLFAAHAPLWEVETASNDDRIGSPGWLPDGRIGIDTDLPVSFTHLSFTRSGPVVLTQLNYVIWFPARPKTGALDIYGGALDGVNYRLTLDPDGNPMLYETIHNCGCYYKAYPDQRLPVRETIAYAEPPLILKAPSINPGSSMVVAVRSRTHYVQHLYALPRGLHLDTVDYVLLDYAALQRLPLATGGYRSMFDLYGLVPGTGRLERFILWPTGVLSPGAMRQWGRHAVAFVGKRHFDDPFYLDNMFSVEQFLENHTTDGIAKP